VDDGRAVAVRDVAQRGDDRVGPVAEVAEVRADHGRLLVVALERVLVPGQDALDRDVGPVARLGVQRAVAHVDTAVADERPRPLQVDLDAGAQVDHHPQAEVVDEACDVAAAQPLEVVRAEHDPPGGPAAALDLEAAEVADVRGAVEVHPALLHRSRCHASTVRRSLARPRPVHRTDTTRAGAVRQAEAGVASAAPAIIAPATTSNAAAHARACSGRQASPATSAIASISTVPTTG